MGSSLARKLQRNQIKQNNISPLYNKNNVTRLSDVDFRKIIHEERRKTSLVAVDVMVATFLATLKECYGFGEKRLTEISKHVAGQITEIAQNRLNIQEIRDILKDTIDYKKIFELE